MNVQINIFIDQSLRVHEFHAVLETFLGSVQDVAIGPVVPEEYCYGQNFCKFIHKMMAAVFNEYFVNIGPNLASNIPDSGTNFRNFLKDQNPQSLFFAPVVEEEVKDIINNLNAKKSSGYDGITNFLLKNIVNEIVTPLTHILNLSLSSEKFRIKWK